MPDEAEQNKYLDIFLTDIQLHTNPAVNPKPFDRQIMKSVRSGKPGRVYNKLLPPSDEDRKNGKFKINLMYLPEIQRAQVEAQKQGKTLRIRYPKDGLKVYAGADTIEFLKARENRKWKPFKPLIGK